MNNDLNTPKHLQTQKYYLNNLGIINALGHDQDTVLANLMAASQDGLRQREGLLLRAAGAPGGNFTWVGEIRSPLPVLPAEMVQHHSRNNQLALAALLQIDDDIRALISRYGAHRIAVVVGSSTSGIWEGEAAILAQQSQGEWGPHYHFGQQEIGAPSEFVSDYYGLSGPSYTISTACSSSAKAFASARNLLDMELCEAVLVGGVDSLCRLTLSGFNALESISSAKANPFSQNRAGITIGEGAAFFIVSREPADMVLAGCGDSSDAYHISAPEPDGKGAEAAIHAALQQAGAELGDVSYINLHGTATIKNDEMESRVVNRLFGAALPVSSSKAQIGHTLGASGANEVGLCWLALSNKNKAHTLPPHCWDGERDMALARVNLVAQGDTYRPVGKQLFISNSFAFGGNNACVAIARDFDSHTFEHHKKDEQPA